MKFRGRGFKQLTGRSNYAQYWVFRGWLCAGRDFDPAWWVRPKNHNMPPPRPAPIPDPQRISTVPFNCIDSGGQFAVRNSVTRAADGGMASAASNAVSKIINRYDRTSIERRFNDRSPATKLSDRKMLNALATLRIILLTTALTIAPSLSAYGSTPTDAITYYPLEHPSFTGIGFLADGSTLYLGGCGTFDLINRQFFAECRFPKYTRWAKVSSDGTLVFATTSPPRRATHMSYS